MGQALEMCVHCENKRGCDMCADLHEWIMEHLEMELKLKQYQETGMEPCNYSAMREEMKKGENAIEHLLYITHIIRNIGSDRIMELAKADQEGRIRIWPQSESGTCGSCGHFKRTPGKRCGICEVRSRWTNRRGQIEENRGTFTPSQSRKACKQYFAREEAEAALDLEGGANMTNGSEKPYDRSGDDAESDAIDDPEWKQRMMQKFVGRR